MATVGTATRIREGVDYAEDFDPRQGWVREFTDVYQVIIDDPHDSGVTVLAGSGVPARGSSHPDDIGAFVIGRRASQESHRKYHAFIRYSSRIPEDQQETNPLLQPVRRRWRSVQDTEIAVRDRDGKHVLNKAQVPYDPPLEKRASRVVLEFVRNESSFDGSLALQFVNRVNSALYSGANPGTLLCSEITGEEAFFNGASYWIVNYVFEYNPAGWQPRLLEQSLIEIGDDGGWYRIKDGDDEPITAPVPIDSSGKEIDPGLLPDAAISTVWDVYEEVNFGILGLPA